MGSSRPSTDDWLLETAQKPATAPDAGAQLARLERSLAELRVRVGTVEAYGDEIDALRLELGVTRRELGRRDQIAREEALALREAIAVTATPPPPPPPPPPPEAAATPEAEFTGIAGEVENTLRAIEERVEEADRRVRDLAGANGTGAPADAGGNGHREPAPDAEMLTDLNRIGFEQLRELGLTVTQAARLLARRDARGEFASLTQLDDLIGFSRELLERLKRSVTV
jgi:hypothetical protein